MACFLLVFSFTSVNAADCEDLISLLPGTVAGMQKTGEVKTLNTEFEGVMISGVKQEYGGKVSVDIFVGDGLLHRLKTLEMMKKMTMEDKEFAVNTTNISGYDSGYVWEKKRQEGKLVIKLSDKKVVVIKAENVESRKYLLSLADDIPLSAIAEQN
jgi:hypothetical protein